MCVAFSWAKTKIIKLQDPLNDGIRRRAAVEAQIVKLLLIF